MLTLLATVGGFLFGYDTANIGSALPFVPYALNGFALGYLVAGASLGAAAGALLAGPLADRFGRKSLLVTTALIYAIGAILSAVTPNAAVLLAARTLIGLAIGADSAIATAYIAEYAPRNRRGALSMLQQWMITVGIVAAFLVALLILWLLPHSASTLDWRLILGVGAIPAPIGLALRTRMPESPRWLLRHERYEQTQMAMGKLGMQASLEDIRYTARELQAADLRGERTRRRSWTRGSGGLGGQLRAHRGVPDLADRHRPGLDHDLLRGLVPARHRLHQPVPAGDQEPLRRGDHRDLREGGGRDRPEHLRAADQGLGHGLR